MWSDVTWWRNKWDILWQPSLAQISRLFLAYAQVMTSNLVIKTKRFCLETYNHHVMLEGKWVPWDKKESNLKIKKRREMPPAVAIRPRGECYARTKSIGAPHNNHGAYTWRDPRDDSLNPLLMTFLVV